jgi:hypothetical protein
MSWVVNEKVVRVMFWLKVERFEVDDNDVQDDD